MNEYSWFSTCSYMVSGKLKVTLDMHMVQHPSKYSPWWRRTEDFLKTSSRRLQYNIILSFKTSWRHNSKMFCKHVLEDVLGTSWRRLEDVLGRRMANTSWRHLEGVFKRSWKTKSVTLKTPWRRLWKQEMFAGMAVAFEVLGL